MTPAILKQHIEKAIAPYIGTYTYKNGYQTQAISVGNPENDLKVDGLEIIIPNFPKIIKSNQSGRFSHREELWDICIIKRSEQDKGKFYQAVDSLLGYFPRCYGNEILQSDIMKTYHQYCLTIKYGKSVDLANYY